MIDKFKDHYSGDYSFPDENIAHDQKTSEWYARFARAIVSSWYNNKTVVGYDDRAKMLENRSYGLGSQSVGRYIKRSVVGRRSQNGPDAVAEGSDKGPLSFSENVRKGMMNVNWDVLPIASKFMSVVKGIFKKIEHEASLVAIDPTSGDERMTMKLESLVAGIFQDLSEKIHEFEGTAELNKMSGKSYPKTVEQAELISKVGGYKLNSELVMETCLKASYEVDTDWGNIQDSVNQDLIDQHKAATQACIDEITGRAYYRYVDITNYIQHWNRSNIDNPKFAGEVVAATLSELRPYFKEKELQAIFRDVSNVMNPNMELPDGYETAREDGSYCYDSFTVQILKAEFLATFIEHKMARRKRDGEWAVFPGEYGKDGKLKTYNSDNRQTWTVSAEMPHKVWYILGTDHVCNYGLAQNVIRDNEIPQLSYSMVRVEGKSPTERCKPTYDQVQMDWYKYQNASAKAAPAGIAIEWQSITGITMGEEKWHPLDVLSVRHTEGDLIYRANTHYSAGMGSSPKPIQELKGGAGQALDDWIKSLDANLGIIREFFGITQPASAPGQMDSRTGLGAMEIQIRNTENALFPIISAYESLYEKTGKKGYRLIQNVFKAYENPEENPYVGNISVMGVKVGDLIASCSMQKYGFKMIVRPNDQTKMEIKAAALESLKTNRSGGVGITYSDYIMIDRLLEAGNIERARVELEISEQRRLEQAAEKSKQDVENQNAAILDQQNNSQRIEQEKAEAEAIRKQQEEDEKLRRDKELEEKRASEKIREEEAKLEAQIVYQQKLTNVLIERGKRMKEAGLQESLSESKV